MSPGWKQAYAPSLVVALLAFLSTAVSTLFFEAVFVRWTRRRRAYDGAWATALAFFALASAAFAVGSSTGWDAGTFRAFYVFGAVVNVPWLALGTLYLLAPAAAARARPGLLVFTGLAAGVVLAAPISGPVPVADIPEGRDLFDAFPRVLAAIGSGVGALVVVGGALWSAARFLLREPRDVPRAAANGFIALGTLVLSAGGLLEGVLGGHDEAFAVTLLTGVVLIYAGFLLATRPTTFLGPGAVRSNDATRSPTAIARNRPGRPGRSPGDKNEGGRTRRVR